MTKPASSYGFSLIEIIVVIIIAGVIAGIAYPRFTITLEKFRMEDGKNILRNLAAAQKRYKTENDAATYLTGLPELAKLDITMRNSPKFTIISICPTSASGDCTSLGRVNRVESGSTLYSLTISTSMVITCAPGAGDPNICTKLGF